MTDDELCAAFDSATLPKEDCHHREHLRVAFIYFARHGEQPVPRFCAALQSFAPPAAGGPAPPAGDPPPPRGGRWGPTSHCYKGSPPPYPPSVPSEAITR